MAERTTGRTLEGRGSRSTTPKAAARRHIEVGSFDVAIRMLPDVTPAEELRFEQALARYFRDRDLRAEGLPLAMTVSSDVRDLSVVDEVDLVAWLMSSAPVAAVRISHGADTVRGKPGTQGEGGSTSFRASQSDLAVSPLLQLYRMGRLRAEVVAQVLAP